MSATELKFPKKKSKKPKLKLKQVQAEFNAMIRRIEKVCATSGETRELQASHFFSVGGSGALRFYPPNVHSQTKGEHFRFHNIDPMPYVSFMQSSVPEFLLMQRMRTATIKYNQETLRHILALCKQNNTKELKNYIEFLWR